MGFCPPKGDVRELTEAERNEKTKRSTRSLRRRETKIVRQKANAATREEAGQGEFRTGEIRPEIKEPRAPPARTGERIRMFPGHRVKKALCLIKKG